MKLYLAPMEGVVDYVVRDLFTELGGYDQCVTEFVRVTQRVLPEHVFYRNCPELLTDGRTLAGVPVFIQLLGGDASLLAENAAMAASLGAPGIDLNFGCPAKTVNRHDGGATLLKNPQRLYDVVAAVKNATPSIPVTAKVRLGFDDKTKVREIARAVDEAGAHRLTVHARTKTEGYRPPAHWEFIAMMKEEVSIPVVANGDIWSVEDFLACEQASQCQDFALGRGAYAQPDLALQIQARKGGEFRASLTWQVLLEKLLLPFIDKNNEFRGESGALNRLKQWVKFLGRNYPEAVEIFLKLKRCTDLDQCRSLMENKGTVIHNSPLSSMTH